MTHQDLPITARAGRDARSSLLPDGDWAVDPDRTSIAFSVRHFRFATVEGRFTAFAGRLSSAGVVGSVDASSIDTGMAARDERLRSPEFFDALRFPRMTVRAAWPITETTEGSCSIRDRSVPVTFAVTARPLGDGAVALHATTRISRRAFGLDWPGLREAGRLLVSDRVQITLDLVVTRG